MTTGRQKVFKLVSWTALILWMVIIYCLSSQPADSSDRLSTDFTLSIVRVIADEGHFLESDIKALNNNIRKNAHFFAYFLLAILGMNCRGASELKDILIVLLFCCLYAISDEIHQYYVPGRGPLVTDVLIDGVGSCLGILVYKGFKMYKRVR